MTDNQTIEQMLDVEPAANDVAAKPDDEQKSDSQQLVKETEQEEDHESETGQEDTKQGKNHQVPYREMKKERERRKIAEERAQRIEREHIETRAKLEERLNMLAQSLQQPEKPKVPDFEENPAEHLRVKTQQLEEFAKQQQQAFLQQQEMASLKNYAAQAEKEFVKQKPDYMDALNHLKTSRQQELMRMSGLDEMQAAQAVAQEEVQLVAEAFQNKRNVAEIVYSLAELRGYRPKQSEQAPKEKLETLDRGLKEARSLSAAAGAAVPPLTIANILAMDDDEYADFCAKYPKKARELRGAV